VSRSVGSALALVEQPRFVENDPDNGMTAVIAERSYSGRSILVGAHGQPLTSWNFVDYDVAYAADGSVALARRHTAQSLGIPAGGDYVQAHDPFLPDEEGSPWSRVAFLPRPQPYVAVAGDKPRPGRAMFQTSAVALTPDGSRAAFLEFRLAAPPDCALWEYDLSHRTWRWVTATPPGHHWQTASVAYSPDGSWLMVTSSPPCIVRAHDGTVVPLDGDVLGVRLTDAGWWPTRPGHLVGTQAGRGHEVDLLDVDLASGGVRTLCTVRARSSNIALYVARPRVSADGRWLALLAPPGLDPVADAGRGSGCRAFVVDLDSFGCELVLPARFACGIERSFESIVWVDQAVSDVAFQPAAVLLARGRPAFGNPALRGSDVATFREQHARAAQLLFEAVDKFGVDAMLVTEEIRRFCAGALEADPSFAKALEGPRDWAFGRYVENGAQRDDRDGWLALSADLGHLIDGKPMEIDTTGNLRAAAFGSQGSPGSR
jgi:hypothetical protein